MTSWMVETLIGSTFLMLLVLLLRRPVARLAGAHAAYALWLLPLLRMALPPIPGWQPLLVPVAAAQPETGHYAVALMPAADAAAYTVPLVPPPAAEPGLVTDWSALLIGLWLAGAAVWLAHMLWRYHRFMMAAVAAGQPLTRVGAIDVIVSPAVDGPMAAGLWRRRILLPADFLARYTPTERRLALLHEGAHHDRRDMLANMAGLVVLSLHWWNPIAHAAWRAFRADQELACDATVLAGADGEARAAYGRAVLKSATTRIPAAACAMNHKSQLKDRIAMMKHRRIGPARLFAGAAIILGSFGLGLAATASGIDQPAPPAPPQPPVPPAVTAAPVPPAPPAPPELKRVEKIVMIHADDGATAKKGKKGGKQEERRTMIIMKHGDGPGPNMVAGEPGAFKLFEAPGMPGGPDHGPGVQEWTDKDGRRIVMLRRFDGDKPGADKLSAEKLAEVRERMAARCAAEGTPVAKDADMGALATCGGAHMKRMEEAMAKAREAQAQSAAALAKAKDAIAKADMSEEDRKIAIAALDRAQRQQVMTFELKRD
jgi:beta-lactamase regulating signal transducer with metallopeptidase domain